MAAFGTERVPADSIVDGAIIDAVAVVDAIRRVFDGNKAFKGKNVCASLSGSAVIVKKITLHAAWVSATARTDVTVTAAAKPTVSFTVSLASPVASQPATFTATTPVAPNHRITQLNRTWGDGECERNLVGN